MRSSRITGRRVRGVSPRRAGAVFGAILGAAYTLQSAPHMVVQSSFDTVGVGLILAVLGAGIGWLGGAMLSLAFQSSPGSATSDDAATPELEGIKEQAEER